MKPEYVKGITSCVLFVATFLFSILPIIIIQKINRTVNSAHHTLYKQIISFMSCFGGGVFLATCLLDLFPEVREELSKALKQDNVTSYYPLPEFIMVCGFLLVLTVEQIVLTCRENSPELEPLLSHSHSYSHSQDANKHNVNPTVNDVDEQSQQDQRENSFHEDPHSHSNLRSLMLVFALSLHSIFEGLAIGLQPTVNDVLNIFAAVIIHKSILAFTLGLNLIQGKLKIKIVVQCVLLFSLMSPIGMIIGIIVTDMAQGLGVILANGILQGIACGTFLYVTFFEVLPHEFSSNKDRLFKLLFVILGFSAISILVGFEP